MTYFYLFFLQVTKEKNRTATGANSNSSSHNGNSSSKPKAKCFVLLSSSKWAFMRLELRKITAYELHAVQHKRKPTAIVVCWRSDRAARRRGPGCNDLSLNLSPDVSTQPSRECPCCKMDEETLPCCDSDLAPTQPHGWVGHLVRKPSKFYDD